jgi:hypothetical protein
MLQCFTCFIYFWHGTLTDGEGSVQLTSSLKQLLLIKKRKNTFSILKAADQNWLVHGGQAY